MMGLAAAAVVVLLLTSAILTAIHDAAFQIANTHVRTLQDEGFDRAPALARVREKKHGVQASIRVVTQTFDLTALSIIALSGVSTWGRAGPVASTAIGVVVVVVFADLIPHIIAARSPVRLALNGASLLLAVERVARPLTGPVERLEEAFGGGLEDLSDQHRELREIQEIGEEEGVLDSGENRLVERAFRLDETMAWDVMVPRVDIFAWNEDRTLLDVIEELSTVPHSRVPVYRESVDDITGILYVREAYAAYAEGAREVRLAELAREPFFVPGSLPLTQLLQDFQARRSHMGIVADEFGGTDGLVTLEDVLEELVGEIRDETDQEEDEIVRISEQVVEVDAGVDLRDLSERFEVPFESSEHRSLNGLILDELGSVPAQGQSLDLSGVRIEILEASETQVRRARLTRLTGSGGEAE
jgi:putative hemolysin